MQISNSTLADSMNTFALKPKEVHQTNSSAGNSSNILILEASRNVFWAGKSFLGIFCMMPKPFRTVQTQWVLGNFDKETNCKV